MTVAEPSTRRSNRSRTTSRCPDTYHRWSPRSRPSVKASAQQSGNALDNAIRQNVIDNVAKLKSAAPILNAAVEQNKLKVVGGIYRLATGKVELVS